MANPRSCSPTRMRFSKLRAEGSPAGAYGASLCLESGRSATKDMARSKQCIQEAIDLAKEHEAFSLSFMASDIRSYKRPVEPALSKRIIKKELAAAPAYVVRNADDDTILPSKVYVATELRHSADLTKRIAKKGLARYGGMLATMLDEGEVTDRHSEDWMRNAAQHGDLYAAAQIGDELLDFAFFSYDLDVAAQLFEKGVAATNPDCMFNLGVLHCDNQTSWAYPDEGLQLLQEAAPRGHADAMDLLAAIYSQKNPYENPCAEKNETLARSWSNEVFIYAAECVLRAGPPDTFNPRSIDHRGPV